MLTWMDSLKGRSMLRLASFTDEEMVNLIDLAQQLKARNIRMTVINPGPTDTTFFEGRIPPEKRGDFLQADDIAELLEFIMTRDKRIVFHDVMLDSFAFYKR